MLFVLAPESRASAASPMVTLETFIETVCRHDTAFQVLLLDELRLRYKSITTLSLSDIVFNIKGEHGMTFGGTQQPKAQLSLEKLFPLKGSALQFNVLSSRVRAGVRRNEFDLVYRVDLLRNAFGRSEKMLQHIVGIENQIARYQILQSYESYLAALIAAYYTWIEAHDKFLAATSSLGESKKLLKNIRKKKSSHIAYQVDVDKALLQVADKQDRVRQTKAIFDETTIRIAYSMGETLDASLIPDTTNAYTRLTEQAEEQLSSITFNYTRTGKIYTTLYQRDSLTIERAAEDVLPSLSLYSFPLKKNVKKLM
jgi:hypothetical protein